MLHSMQTHGPQQRPVCFHPKRQCFSLNRGVKRCGVLRQPSLRPQATASPGIRPADQPDSWPQQQQTVGPVVDTDETDTQNLFGKLWQAYNTKLHESPILVKSATSFFGFLLGDLMAQLIVGNPFNYFRTARLVLFGMFMDGPVGHLWYTTLDKKVMPDRPTSNRAVVLKMLADQVLWAPFFSCVFFTFVYMLQLRPEAILPAIQKKLVPMLLCNYALWPLAHMINFKFVPTQQRILYINCVQIVWSAYMSHIQR